MVESRKVLYKVEAMGGGVFAYLVDLANELANMTDLNGSYIFEMFIAYGVRKQTPKDYKRYFDRKNHLHSSRAGALERVAFNGFKVDRKPAPLFYTPHGYSFLMKNQSASKRMVHKLIESGCGKLNCTTISCSRSEHQESLKLNKKAVYVDNGINVKDLNKTLRKIKIEAHPFTVFTLGRVCYQKKSKMFNQVADAMPDVKFLWIGNGELREELKSKNIEITGWDDHKTELIKSMTEDAFVLTSLWKGLPISLLEVMYMKKPCVVSDAIDNHDVIQNNENGLVCQDVNDFLDVIRRIQREMVGQAFGDAEGTVDVYLKVKVGGDTTKLVEKAYDDIMKKYNTQVMAEKYSKIYGGERYNVNFCAFSEAGYAAEKAVA